MNDVWELPVHRSLTKPLYWMGVPRGLLISEVLVAILGGVLFKTFIVPVICLAADFVFRHLGAQDAMFLGVFMRYLRHNSFYN